MKRISVILGLLMLALIGSAQTITWPPALTMPNTPPAISPNSPTAASSVAALPIPDPPQATSPVTLQVPKLPAMFGAYGQFNQLGSPRFNGGVVAIYPVFQSVGIYGSTITDLFPSTQKDPTTGRSFYALNTSVRQGFHKDMLDTWKFSFFLGGDIGPSFSSNTSAVVSGGVATITVSLSSSATGTLIYKATPWMDVLGSARMLYVSGAGWNPVAAVGVLFNLKKLPAAK